MLKVTFVFNRAEGKTSEEVRDWILNSHAPIVARLPGIRRYVINLVEGAPEGTPQCDGISDLVFDDAKAMEAAFTSPVGMEMQENAAPWVGSSFAVFVDEHVIVDQPVGVA